MINKKLPMQARTSNTSPNKLNISEVIPGEKVRNNRG